MAIEKRKLDHSSLATTTTTCSRNVRPRLEELKTAQEEPKKKQQKPKFASILRRQRRYSSSFAPFVPPLTTRSNNVPDRVVPTKCDRMHTSYYHWSPRTQYNEHQDKHNDVQNQSQENERPETTSDKYCKNIRFHKTVSVTYIPSRFHYPERMRKSLWGTLKEISENAKRNTIEFAAEGWNWRLATEDDAMYTAPNGEKVHPAHVRIAANTNAAIFVRRQNQQQYHRRCVLVQPPSSSHTYRHHHHHSSNQYVSSSVN